MIAPDNLILYRQSNLIGHYCSQKFFMSIYDRVLVKRFSIVVALSLATSCFFIFVFHYRQAVEMDSVDYDAIAWSFAQGHGLQHGGNPLIYKTPTYPIFVGSLYFLFGHFPIYVVSIQVLLYTVSCILLYYISRNFFDTDISFLSSFIMATYFPLAYYASSIITETLSIFLTALVINFWIQYVRYSQIKYLIFCGIFLGMDILCKPMLFFFPFVMFLLLISQRIKIKELFFSSGVFFLSIGIILASWGVRNYLIFDEFILLSKGNMGGIVLQGALDHDHKYFLWNDVHSWRMERSNDPRNAISRDIKERIERALASDQTQSKDLLYLKEAGKIILQDPVAYALGCLVRIARLWISYPTRSGFWLKAFVTSYDVALLALAITGFLTTRHQWKQYSILWLSVLYITIIHLPMHVEPRYAAPMKPYFLIFTAIGLWRISQWAMSRHIFQGFTLFLKPKYHST